MVNKVNLAITMPIYNYNNWSGANLNGYSSQPLYFVEEKTDVQALSRVAATGHRLNGGGGDVVGIGIQDSTTPPTASSETCFHLMRKMPATHLDLDPEHFPEMESTALICQTKPTPDSIDPMLVHQSLKYRKSLGQAPFWISPLPLRQGS